MKSVFFIFLFTINLFSFESALIKPLSTLFYKNSINKVSKKYGEYGVKAFEKLHRIYGKKTIQKLEYISSKYGTKGIELASKYGHIAFKNKTTFNMVSKYQDKAIYMLQKYPQSEQYFQQYGNLFMDIANKFGNKRVIKYLDQASKYNKGKEVLEFIQKGGSVSVKFIEKNWGKLLVSGFVLSNSNEIIGSSQNILNNLIKNIKDTITNSNLLNWIGGGLFLYILAFAIPTFIQRMKTLSSKK